LTSNENPIVLIKTALGDIKAEIYLDKAPITASNFLRYVDEKLFNGSSFSRTVTLENQPTRTQPTDIKIEVIQSQVIPPLVEPETRISYASIYPPIVHETTEMTGLRHLDGSLSMARAKPGSATSSFMVCINDQPELNYGGKRNSDGQGFAVFGQVLEGMDVVRNIHQQPYGEVGGREQRLTPPIDILSIRRVN
jgi:peptidyl-prolyl cis-trans isomerase A (cyclophilin A)